MGIALPDDIAFARLLMHRVTDRVTRRNAELPQEQHGGCRKIFAMALARLQQEARERSQVGVIKPGLFLPEAVGESSGKKAADGAKGLLFVETIEVQFRSDLLERGSFPFEIGR